jgi:hypothetical protein
MKTSIFLFLPIFVVCAAGQAAGQAAKQPAGQTAAKTPPKAEPAKPLEIPAGAVETEPGVFRFADSAGKKWIYRKTPFGVSRREDQPDAAPKSTAPDGNVKAFEEGDSVRFERTSPFGVSKWVKKKSDLNDQERSVWERDKAQGDKSKQDNK